jgi:FtsH-binding integral membrane protein
MSRPKGNRKVAAGKNATGKIAAQAKLRPKAKRPVDRRAPSAPAESTKQRRRGRDTNRELIAGVDQKMWMAVWLASMISIFGLFALGFSLSEEIDTSARIGTRVAGLIAAPLTFVALAFVSRVERPWRAIGLALGAFVAVGSVGVLMYFLGADEAGIIFALTIPMALGAGGAYALRIKREEARRTRMYSVLLFSVVGFFLFLLIPEIGLVLAPSLPFPALIVADYYFERRLKKAAEAPSTSQ